MNLNVYTAHSTEHSRSRATSARKTPAPNEIVNEKSETSKLQKNVSFKMETKPKEEAPVLPEVHPLTDAIINSILNKSTVYKPDLSVKKTPETKESFGEIQTDTVEDLLARRMRDHLLVHGTSSSDGELNKNT